jgi:hypothetical protein
VRIKTILAYETFQEQDITPLFNSNYCPLSFGCGGSVAEEDKNNTSVSSLSLYAGNEK